MTRCSYKHCKSDSRKNKKVKFRPFPKRKNLMKCLKWIELCGNEKLTPESINRNTYICSKHFSGKFSYDSYPHPFSQVQVYSNENNFDQNLASISLDDSEENTGTDFNRDLASITPDVETDCNNVATQTDRRDDTIFSYVNLRRSDKDFKFITGLRPLHFDALYNFLDPSVMNKLNYYQKYENEKNRYNINERHLSNYDRLCLTLVRLRRGFTLGDISMLTGLSKSNISVISNTWIQFMYCQMASMREEMFQAAREKKENPYCFENFKDDSITISIDCTEIEMKIPTNFRQQSDRFSSHEHSSTVKFLLGVCPSGAIIYVSEGFDGSISNKEIFENSDIRNFLKEGDVIMADRSFLIQDLCDEMKIKLYTPPLIMKSRKLTGNEELLRRKIAKARMHVERAISLMKSYRILSKKCPFHLEPLISNIFSVVSFLLNFQKQVI